MIVAASRDRALDVGHGARWRVITNATRHVYYCAACGAATPDTAEHCHECGMELSSVELGDGITTLVAMLGTVRRWRAEELIDQRTFERLRLQLEQRLERRREARESAG